jgi:hypothetical protein
VDRDEIVRDDFPTARRGYDPEAVRTHLRSVAAAFREPSSTPLAAKAADRVAAIVEAAEKQAAEIEVEARSEADRIVAAAREEAKEQVDRAQGAVSKLVEQADELRSAVGKLGSDIASQVKPGGPAAAKAETPAPPEIDPQPPHVPEPTPPLEPEPTPPQTPEPTPPLTPEPTPPQTPEPQPPGPQIAAGGPSTQDLLAQLKGDAPAAAERPAEDAGNGAATESADDGDVAAARLVAMKMALDGASRDEIATHLEDNFSLSRADELLDDVLTRAKA